MDEREEQDRQALANLMRVEIDRVHEMLRGDERITDVLQRRLTNGDDVSGDYSNWVTTHMLNFVNAVAANTDATVAVLQRLETKLDDGGPAFPAPPAVLAEGEFLKSQLAVGRLGTTSAEPGFAPS